MDMVKLPYKTALIPGVLLALLWLPGLNLSMFDATSLLYLAGSFAWGVAAGAAYIFVFNHIETRRLRTVFLIFSVIALPFIAYGVLLGGLLGPVGIMVGTGVPLLILLLFVGGVVYREEGIRMRAAVSAGMFIALVALAVFFIMAENAKFAERNCAEGALGTWNEAEERCTVAPEQTLRNAIFFSSVFLPEGISISFSDAIIGGATPHATGDDLLAEVYLAGAESGTARYRTELALAVGEFTIVPVTLESLNRSFILSLRPTAVTLASVPTTELAGFVELNPGDRVMNLTMTGESMLTAVMMGGTALETAVRSFTVNENGGIVETGS